MLRYKIQLVYENDSVMSMIERMNHVLEPYMEKAEQDVQMFA